MRIGLPEVRGAARLLEGIAHRTPLFDSESLSKLVGSPVTIKAEHLQRTGSFKIRGAYVRIAALTQDERRRGVVAASAGNHAQGVAWAAARLGVRATIVMPVYASLPKVEATRGYGAEVVLSGDTFEDALASATGIADSRGAVFVHAFDDERVMAGQATVGLEICEDAGDVDRVLVPVGGGGLMSGVAIVLRELRPHVGLIGVRAAAAPNTIADGAAVSALGTRTRAIIDDLVDGVVEVGEEAISEAMVLLLERAKQVVEGAGALPLAALLAGAVPRGPRTILLASGGNVDPGLLARVIRHGLGTAGRYLFLRMRMRDRPGELQRALAVIAREKANVVSVVHHRVGLTLPIDEVEVELTLETRDRSHATELVSRLRESGFHIDT